MDSEIIVQNIQKYCKRSGIKVTPACRNSGAGPNLLQDLKGGKDISLKRIKMLAEYLNITTSELLGEKMPASENEGGLSETEQQIMKCVGRMSERQREAFLAYLQASQGHD